MNRTPALLTAVLAAGLVTVAIADGPADNIPEKVRPVPPPGVPVAETDRQLLSEGLSDLGKSIDALKANPKTAPFVPDVQIYHNAVRYALQYNEFFAPADIGKAKTLLSQGKERARQLAAGQMPWLTQTGPIALGYVSKIDGSVQPYGLSVPATYTAATPHRWRLDTWFHGRGETLSEINFLTGVQANGGPFARPDLFVVQPYGRYCNANKLAGEVDLFEALSDIQRRYRIDENRLVVRGFSMGGAAAWQFAAHYAGMWAAAAPGAGFSETPDFLKVFQKETLKPTWWEQKLWQMYDCPYYAANFHNLPTVVYSGENDSQKQAADIMEKALAGENLRMTHIIGPKTGHSYHPASKPEIDRLIDAAVDRGRNPVPRRVHLVTPTLKYNRQAWVVVDGLARHWMPARVEAEIVNDRDIKVTTSNVTALTLDMPAGYCPLSSTESVDIMVDRERVTGVPVSTDRSWTVHIRKTNNGWKRVDSADDGTLRKRHDLQGPIDDAFMDSFVIVRPTGEPQFAGLSRWVDSELQHAVVEWRRQFRGDARVKNDSEITDADIANSNLALWGDPGSNKILARIADKLPIRWSRDGIVVGKERYASGTHVPVMIFPNPLNSRKYVVLNSGFTYREYDYLNNARQVPKLPDWAVVDTTTPPNSRYPGKIVNAGFFGERWEVIDPPKP